MDSRIGTALSVATLAVAIFLTSRFLGMEKLMESAKLDASSLPVLEAVIDVPLAAQEKMGVKQVKIKLVRDVTHDGNIESATVHARRLCNAINSTRAEIAAAAGGS